MTLVLTILRCPDNATPEVRRVNGGELRIGRDPSRVDWVLRDSDQHLSRQHCVVRFDGTHWQVADTSSNGTFLNHDAAPVGAAGRTLKDGDRLRLGAYEIEVRTEDAALGRSFDAAAAPSGLFGRTPKAPDNFSGFGAEDFAGPEDPFADPYRHDPPVRPATQPDHTPSFTDALPQQAGRAQLGEDWEQEFEFLGNAAPAAPPPVVASPPVPAAHPAAIIRPADPPPLAPPPRAAPISSAAIADDSVLLAAFMDGAGLGDLTPQDPVAAMRNIGAAFRAFVGGLREALMVRAEIKSALRIEQTSIRARGNNPLKFSAGDDDALTALLGTGRRTDMTPQAAVTEALRDLRHHEQATMPAVQAALRGLLERLNPEQFRAAGEAGGLALPAQKRARSFDAFEAEYAKLRTALADDFDAVFGRRFAEAYEAMVADLQRTERKP